MANGKFVSYLRVSTARQGASGLGLEAQRAAVAGYLNGGDWTLVQEVLEVESGKRNDRPALADALRLCRKQKATLVIAKLDRLARNVAFISNLMESGVEFVAVDMPQANRFVVHILAAVAEQEAEAISKRTKAALAAAKARGTQLGGRRVSAERFAEIGFAARQLRMEKADKRAAELLPVIQSIQAEGAKSLRQIAAGLNERNISTPRGGEWSAVQVQRALTAARGYRVNQEQRESGLGKEPRRALSDDKDRCLKHHSETLWHLPAGYNSRILFRNHSCLRRPSTRSSSH
jgi:DNA invertase Pin-like site-specific DNA recombinase